MVDRLALEYGSRVTFVRLDVGDPAVRDAVDALRVRGHPTLVLFDAVGVEARRFVGPAPEEDIVAAIAEALR